MIAGPNGSGKSTLTKQLVAAGVELGRYINADEIDASLPGPPGEDRSRRAQALADEARQKCLDQGISFAFETVMSHPSKIEVLREARKRGYAVLSATGLSCSTTAIVIVTRGRSSSCRSAKSAG
jgi:predicted ABC-type ATPase